MTNSHTSDHHLVIDIADDGYVDYSYKGSNCSVVIPDILVAPLQLLLEDHTNSLASVLKLKQYILDSLSDKSPYEQEAVRAFVRSCQ